MRQEQYVSLPTQPQNKYTPYYQSYGHQKYGNIGEQNNILTSYNQVTRQTNSYDLMTAYPSVLATYEANQIISNARPVPIYDANAVGAAQRASYAIQQRQFDNNIQSGVNYIMTPQIQQVQQSVKPAINSLNFQNIPAREPGAIANSAYRNVNPNVSGTLIQTPEGQIIGQRGTRTYTQSATTNDVISPEYDQTDYEIAEYITSPEMYQYLSGFPRFRKTSLTRERYDKVINLISFDTYGVTKSQIQNYINSLINKYQINSTQFIRDYLEAVVIGKLNGVDITQVWNKNGYFNDMNSDTKAKVKKAIAQIISTRNLQSKL